jgi:hypothetical protein
MKPKADYICTTCSSQEMTFDEMKSHLLDKHKINTATDKCQRQMLSHVDGRDCYSSTYKMDWPGVEIMSYVTNQREKNDPMRY